MKILKTTKANDKKILFIIFLLFAHLTFLIGGKNKRMHPLRRSHERNRKRSVALLFSGSEKNQKSAQSCDVEREGSPAKRPSLDIVSPKKELQLDSFLGENMVVVEHNAKDHSAENCLPEEKAVIDHVREKRNIMNQLKSCSAKRLFYLKEPGEAVASALRQRESIVNLLGMLNTKLCGLKDLDESIDIEDCLFELDRIAVRIKSEDQIIKEVELYLNFEKKIADLLSKYYSFLDLIITGDSFSCKTLFCKSNRERLEEKWDFLQKFRLTVLDQQEKSVKKIFILHELFSKLSYEGDICKKITAFFSEENQNISFFTEEELNCLYDIFKENNSLVHLAKDSDLEKITTTLDSREKISHEIGKLIFNHIFDFAADYFALADAMLKLQNVNYQMITEEFFRLLCRQNFFNGLLQKFLASARTTNLFFNQQV